MVHNNNKCKGKSYSTMVGGGHGPSRNQPKIIFKNHSRPLDSIGQA